MLIMSIPLFCQPINLKSTGFIPPKLSHGTISMSIFACQTFSQWLSIVGHFWPLYLKNRGYGPALAESPYFSWVTVWFHFWCSRWLTDMSVTFRQQLFQTYLAQLGKCLNHLFVIFWDVRDNNISTMFGLSWAGIEALQYTFYWIVFTPQAFSRLCLETPSVIFHIKWMQSFLLVSHIL